VAISKLSTKKVLKRYLDEEFLCMTSNDGIFFRFQTILVLNVLKIVLALRDFVFTAPGAGLGALLVRLSPSFRAVATMSSPRIDSFLLVVRVVQCFRIDKKSVFIVNNGNKYEPGDVAELNFGASPRSSHRTKWALKDRDQAKANLKKHQKSQIIMKSLELKTQPQRMRSK